MRFWGDPFSFKRRMRYRAADFAMHRLRFSAFAFNEEDLAQYWERCLRFRPDYFYGYVSMISSLARFLQDSGRNGRDIQLKLVITTSEVLSPPDQALIADTFGCPVQNEYGCGEVGPIAYTCPAGSLHAMDDHVLVEVIDPVEGTVLHGAGQGQLAITDLHNRAMPLIRYRVGDNASVKERYGCSCGRPFSRLEKIWGREYDFVVDREGRRFHGEFFMYLFEEMRDCGIGVDSFQVRQTAASTLEIRIAAPAISEAQQAFLTERLKTSTAGLELVLKPVDAIGRAASGKMQLIVNELARTSRSQT